MTQLIPGQAFKLYRPPSLTISGKLITVGIPTKVRLVNVQNETQTETGFRGVLSAMDRDFRIPDDSREEIHRRVFAKLQINGELFPQESGVAEIDFWWDIQKDIEDTVAEVLRNSVRFQESLRTLSRNSRQQQPSSTKMYEQKLFSWLDDWVWTARIQDDDMPERMISISTTDSRSATRVPQYDLQLVTGRDPGPQGTRSSRVRFTVPQIMVLTNPRTGETRLGKMSDALLQQISRSTAILLKRAELSPLAFPGFRSIDLR